MQPTPHSRLRRYLTLAYPVRICLSPRGVHASFPDLPEVRVTAADVDTAYSRLEQAKRTHLAAAVAGGGQVPMPNSHLHRA